MKSCCVSSLVQFMMSTRLRKRFVCECDYRFDYEPHQLLQSHVAHQNQAIAILSLRICAFTRASSMLAIVLSVEYCYFSLVRNQDNWVKTRTFGYFCGENHRSHFRSCPSASYTENTLRDELTLIYAASTATFFYVFRVFDTWWAILYTVFRRILPFLLHYFPKKKTQFQHQY